ncbi:MAG: hypothetical protein AAF337_12050 [Pseudomonadota bacterium]
MSPSPTKQLAAGATISVGGYALTPELFSDFQTMKLPSDIKGDADVIFVGRNGGGETQETGSEGRLLAAFRSRFTSVSHRWVDDVQVWHQGVPEEPTNLPGALAEAVLKAQDEKAQQNAA